MQFKIPCNVFARLALATEQYTHVLGPEFKVVVLEYIAGKAYAIATNRHIMAMEYIGPVDAPDGRIDIPSDPALILQCDIESDTHGELFIDRLDGIAYATAKTSSGWSYPGNAGYFCAEPMDWRRVIDQSQPEEAEPFGHILLDTELIRILGSTSPSKRLTFPAKLDARYSVVLNDLIDSNWIGFFRSAFEVTNPPSRPAVFPDWMPL